MPQKQVNFRLDEDLYERVEKARADTPRNTFLLRAVERELERDEYKPKRRKQVAGRRVDV